MDTLRRVGKKKGSMIAGIGESEQKTVNPLMAQRAAKAGLPQLDVKSATMRGALNGSSSGADKSRSPRTDKGSAGGTPISSPRGKNAKETVRSNPIFQYYNELINTSHKTKKVWNEEPKEEPEEEKEKLKEKEKEDGENKQKEGPAGEAKKENRKSKLGSISSKSEPHLVGEDETPASSSKHEQNEEATSKSDATEDKKNSSSPKQKKKKRKKSLTNSNPNISISRKDEQRLSVAVPSESKNDENKELRRTQSDEDLHALLSNPALLDKVTHNFTRSFKHSPDHSPRSVSSTTSSRNGSDNEEGNHKNDASLSPIFGEKRLRRTLSEGYMKGNQDGFDQSWVVPSASSTFVKRRSTQEPIRNSHHHKVISESQPVRTRSASVCIGRSSPISSPIVAPVQRSRYKPGIFITTTTPPPVSPDVTEEDQLQWTEKDGRKVVTYGTLDKLIQSLAGTQSDPDYIYSFLLSHPYFTDSVTVLTKLKEIFFSAEGLKTSSSETPLDETAIKANRMITQLRVINVLKKWVENHYYFFERNEQLRETFTAFLEQMCETPQQKEWASLLRKLLEEKPKEEHPKVVIDAKDEKLRPYLPKNIQSSQLSFMDIHPLEVARQMTLLDHSIFSLIEPGELYKTAWAKGEKSRAPNVIELTERFNKICFWVATEIITTKNHKLRVEVLARFIQLAMYLRSMNNFHGVMEIYASLNLGCVQRLKSTWKEVDKKEIARLKEIEAMFDPTGNYKNYRERLEAVTPPIIPFQAVYLADLTFIEEIPSFLESGLINFEKMRLLGKVISEIERYQKCPYSFYLVPPIEDFFKNSLSCLSEKELYDMAKLHELEMKEEREKGGGVMTLRRGDPITMGTLKFDKQRRKQIKELEKQEKKLMRSISFRSQSKGNRVRSATYT